MEQHVTGYRAGPCLGTALRVEDKGRVVELSEQVETVEREGKIAFEELLRQA